VSHDDRYPVAVAALRALLGRDGTASTEPLASFRLGPSVLRAPPAVSARADVADVADVADDVDNDADDTGDLLGELVDMVLVGADDSDSRHPEVHLQFKADVFGGLHLQLQKTPEGLVATFSVADAAARRAVVDQVDGLLVHLKQRGFSIVRHSVDVASS
jgi:hypothetical protein